MGAPLDGVGIQLHIDHRVPAYKGYDATEFAAAPEKYAALGLEIHVTELDVKPSDPMYAGLEPPEQLRAQAALYASALSVCRAQRR